ncbi:hypothetical protein [Sporolactobacillus terrae]|uniref:hypothetical protein n=1 Tax=Sporolactobacillus terrae TaxID=269673 RepID=UPI001CBDE679|nr:hypothetical protein [Sporolactobacillus terrae]UAK17554.1 hypothetical protein K7399_06405 [Sporolactobacillus terrae]
MATIIQLKIKDETGNIKTENHEIEEIRLDQYIGMMKVVNDILKELKGNEGLIDLLNYVGAGDDIPGKNLDQDFVIGIINSFDVLAVRMPEKAINLLSVVSGINSEALNKQTMTTIMDVYDAVITENDIEKLMNRAKKSLALTKSKIKLKSLVNKLAPAPKETESEPEATQA